MKERRKLGNSTAFCNGLFEIQDAASQHVAPLLQVEPGQVVIDACCGAGGKTLHLAALMRNKGRLLALDVRDKPLHALAERAKRASISIIELGVLDKDQVHTDLFATADRVLLDVPCSGLGTLRRNADLKWKLTAKEVARLTRVQAHILSDYSKFVKPGGKLVYATCSLLNDENQQIVSAFLAAHPQFTALNCGELLQKQGITLECGNHADPAALEANPVEELERIYVKSYEKSKEDEDWLRRAKEDCGPNKQVDCMCVISTCLQSNQE